MVSFDKLPALKVGEFPLVVFYETEGGDGGRAIVLLKGVTRTVPSGSV